MEVTKEQLDELAARYETPDFIESDPVQFPRRYASPQDIEIVGLLSAMNAWGNRKCIIRDCEAMFGMMDESPSRFVMEGAFEGIDPDMNIHRTFFGRDMIYICRGLKWFYEHSSSLENIIHTDVWLWIERFKAIMVKANKGEHNRHFNMSVGSRRSACKRLNLFLRWMVRTDSPVDLGLWKRTFSPKDLRIPLDVHVAQTAREMGIITRKTNDLVNVEVLTERLRKFCPDDPCKYDFALFGYGEEHSNSKQK